MKELILKLALIFLILILIKMPFVFFFNDEVSYRNSEILKQEYDTVLIGSSRTQYGIKPAYFDSLNGNKVKTYNFGISAGILPYTFDWCEKLIKSKKSLRYIIFELSGSGGLARNYIEPWEEFRMNDYLEAVQSYPFQKSTEYHDRLAVGFFKPQWNYVEHFDNNTPLERLYDEYSFPEVTISSKELELAQKRNLAVEKGDLNMTGEPDAELWQRIIRLISLAESANVRIYFFIPPRLETANELKIVYPLWHKLDERYKLPVNHYEDALYTFENSIDDFHLNHKGAIRFTENMADAFSRLSN